MLFTTFGNPTHKTLMLIHGLGVSYQVFAPLIEHLQERYYIVAVQVDGFLLDAEGKATMGLVYLIGSLWVVNGYIHGMGYPPCASLMAHWFRPSELATKQSIWNASHSIGAGIVIALCGWLLSRFGMSAWNLCFAIPAAIALIGAIVVFLTLRDTPSSVGLPEVEDE